MPRLGPYSGTAILSKLDGRTREARLMRGTRSALIAHVGGKPSVVQQTLIDGPIAPAGNSDWQVAQFTVEEINKNGGILGQPVELYLEDTASDPKIAVGNVRRLIQERKVDVVLGGITSAMRQARTNETASWYA